MQIKELLREKLKSAMIAKDEFRRDVLRVLLGDMDAQASREKNFDDTGAIKIFKKMLQNGKELEKTYIDHNRQSEEGYKKLVAENVLLFEILKESVPGWLTKENLFGKLLPMVKEIKEAKSEGMAIGLVNKYLKTAKFDAFGEDIANVVKTIREQMAAI